MREDKTKTINSHKDKRIDAQYYTRVGKKEQVRAMLQEAKIFISEFDELVSNLTEKEITLYQEKLK